MQDRYTGDVGDYGKHGLLRALCGLTLEGGASLRLGVVWYRTRPEHVGDPPGQEDGRFRSYLQRRARRFRDADPSLHAALQVFLDPGARSVDAIPGLGILPVGTRFHAGSLSLPGARPAERLAHREAWLTVALTATGDADLVFLDPDNGLECASAPPGSRRGPKYARVAEVQRFRERGQGVVLYHHTGRRGGDARTQTATQLHRLGGDGVGLVFHRGSVRAFLVLPAPQHRELVLARVGAFLGSDWSQRGHFDAEAVVG